LPGVVGAACRLPDAAAVAGTPKPTAVHAIAVAAHAIASANVPASPRFVANPPITAARASRKCPLCVRRLPRAQNARSADPYIHIYITTCRSRRCQHFCADQCLAEQCCAASTVRHATGFVPGFRKTSLHLLAAMRGAGGMEKHACDYGMEKYASGY
jgi:hypothetical protein